MSVETHYLERIARACERIAIATEKSAEIMDLIAKSDDLYEEENAE